MTALYDFLRSVLVLVVAVMVIILAFKAMGLG